MAEARLRKALLVADATFLLVASTGGMIADLAGAFAGIGPQRNVLGPAPYAAIGFVEAHGLAFILGVLLWRAEPVRSWHFAAGAVHVLLGTSNLLFWQIFIATDMLAMGWVTTVLHWLFVALQLTAAAAPTYSRRGS
jgi:hypothetical protein